MRLYMEQWSAVNRNDIVRVTERNSGLYIGKIIKTTDSPTIGNLCIFEGKYAIFLGKVGTNKGLDKIFNKEEVYAFIKQSNYLAVFKESEVTIEKLLEE